MKQISTLSYLIFFVFILVPAMCAAFSFENHNSEAISKTTLTIDPVFRSGTPELITAFRNDRNHICKDACIDGAVQIAILGGKSVDPRDLARYFFPEGQESLVCAEDGPADNFSKQKNLLAQNFNIFTQNGNFTSEISIFPEQTVFGIGFHWRQSFWKSESYGRGVWISLSSPLLRVKHTMNLQETVLTTSPVNDNAADVVVADMTEGLNQPTWKYSKITQRAMVKTGLADIEFKLGYEWLQHKPFHMESYAGMIIPTGNKPKSEYTFEPIVGRGHHTGIMFGSSLGLEIWTHDYGDRSIRYELTNHSEYLFNNTQVRSFDLKHRPWSRYIQVYYNQQEALDQASLAGTGPSGALKAQNNATPGINVLTQDVHVTPGFSNTINTAFLYTHKEVFQMEIGYNFFSKRAEHVKLAKSWKEEAAIKHFQGDGTTNPIRDITGNKYLEQTVIGANNVQLIPVLVQNYTMSMIVEDQLDLESATTPCTLAHTLYGALTYRWDEKRYPTLVDGGFSYTFSKSNNATVRRWLLWLKCATSF